MSDSAERFGKTSTRLISAALVTGLISGVVVNATGDSMREPAVLLASTVGGFWLDALRMTILPLLFALIIKGVVTGASAIRGERLAARLIGWFLALSLVSAVIGAIATPFLLAAFPLPAEAIQALRGALGTVDQAAIGQSTATTADFVRSFIPTNPIKAAADGSVLQVMIFGFLFAVALGFLEPRLRDPVVTFFDAVGQAMMVIVGWILVLAPLGVFALSFALGAGAGGGALGAVAHYFLIYGAVGLIVLLLAYAVAVGAARFGLGRFARTMVPAQSFALSTQSSTASLPLMVEAARELGVGEQTRDVSLPMSVALFRASGPAMNIAVCFYMAHWLGLPLNAGAIAAGVAVATFASISAPGLPGQLSFISSVGPIAVAMGLPLAPLGIFIALEPIPDMLRTMANVTMDVAVSGAVDRKARAVPKS
ncbi:MAG: cation:dicarboxylase symporter family transporter [Pseudomonadota bacterium]